MTECFRVDMRRATWVELWRMIRHPIAFAIAAFWRVSRPPPKALFAYKRNSLQYIKQDKVPAQAIAKLRPLVDECAVLGFEDPQWTTMSMIGPIEGYGCIMLHKTGDMYIVVAWSRGTLRQNTLEETVIGVASRLKSHDDRILGTTNARKRFDAPAES